MAKKLEKTLQNLETSSECTTLKMMNDPRDEFKSDERVDSGRVLICISKQLSMAAGTPISGSVCAYQ